MFLPAHQIERAPEASPTRYALFLHGILGSRRNWRGIAREMVRRWPDWALVLVDLRNHGESTGAEPPHTLEACADDLAALVQTLPRPPEAIIGHSYGGKVALTYARDHGEHLAQVWVLDSLPGGGDSGEVGRVIASLRAVPQPLSEREALARILTGEGYSERLVRWMNTNLVREDDGYRWRFDLDAVAEMLVDYSRADLHRFLDDTALDVHIVRAGRSSQWTDAVLARLDRCSPTVVVHPLEEAGHWLHVDDPEGLIALLGRGFGRQAPGAAH